jgi:hypothetical protein
LVLLPLLTLLAFSCSSGAGQEEEVLPAFFGSLQQGEPLEMVLEFNLAGLDKDNKAGQREQARLILDKDGIKHTYNVEIYARGNMRKRYCNFPPLKLCFDKRELNEAGFAKSSPIKLVTHCRDSGDVWVLKEYLAYLLYNEMTELSFRVQLVRIRYIDSSGEMPDEEHFAFLVEPKKELAHRLNADIVALAGQPKGIQAEPYRQFVLFQYMIGNTDWGMHGHNLELLQMADQSFPCPVPYDFDQAGLVNAPYAIPHPNLPISSVAERFFQWRGGKLEGFGATIQQFLDKKARLLEIIAGFDYLDLSQREQMAQYLESFFQIIEQDVTEDQWPVVFNSVFQQ